LETETEFCPQITRMDTDLGRRIRIQAVSYAQSQQAEAAGRLTIQYGLAWLRTTLDWKCVLKRLSQVIQLGTALILLTLSGVTLRHLSQTLSWEGLVAALRGMTVVQVLLATVAATLNHVILMGYDLVAYRLSAAQPVSPTPSRPRLEPSPTQTLEEETQQSAVLPWQHVAQISFVAYVFSHCLGLAMLSGTSVRLRFYEAAGVKPVRLLRLIGWVEGMVWMGYPPLLALLLLYVTPLRLPDIPHWAEVRDGLTAVGLVLGLVWPVVSHFLRRKWSTPTAPVACLQILMSAIDWCLNALVLYALLPSESPFQALQIIQLFLLVQVAGIISQVPGGMGVFDSAMLLALCPPLAVTTVTASLLMYRVIYYLLPMLLAIPIFVRLELSRRSRLRLQATTQALSPGQTPLRPGKPTLD